MKIKIPVPDSNILKTDSNYVAGLYVAIPHKRDNINRPPVTVNLSKKVVKKTIKEIQ